MRVRGVLLIFCFGLILACRGQNLTNLSAVQQGNDVMVSYSLEGEKGKAYLISLYASNNNFATPLQLVQGDVASKRVLPGAGKAIRWRVLDELRNFDADISFEIRATVAPPLFSKIASSASKVKRGKEVTVNWAGGAPREKVTVNFLKDDKIVSAGTVDNSGHLVFAVPMKMKTGGYRVQLSQAGEEAVGESITIQPKIPLFLKIATVAVVGTGIYIATRPEKEKFPEPPDLTN